MLLHPRILVVDDSVDSARTLVRLLALMGHTGHAAYNGSSALEAARILLPDAVLLDLTLPDMSGQEVAAEIRSSGELQGTVIIAVSGYRLDGPSLSLFDGHVVKPADVERILEAIANAEARRRPKAEPVSA